MTAVSEAQTAGRELAGFAMVDPGLMGLNLFRPLPRRNRTAARKCMFEVETVHDGRRLRVAGAYTLGADDLSVLLAVLALAGLLGRPIEATASEASRVAIVDGLESKGEVVEAKHVRLRTTLYALCHEAGVPTNGDTYERVTNSLWRMGMIGYADLGPVGSNSRSLRLSGSQRLLSAGAHDATGEVTVVVNARFAAVLLGAHFVRVDLKESRDLGEMARLLHLRLSVMVREGKALTVPTDQLCEWVYGAPPRTATQRTERRKEVRPALDELGALSGWDVGENRRRLMVSVARDSRK